MNIIEIFGNLVADPESRVTPSGIRVTNIRLACNTRRNGKDETMWWRITLWGTTFDKMLPHLKKGSSLIAIGEMSKPEIYVDKEGNQQVSLSMTAECLRFNPFGKSDKPAGQEQRPAMQGATPYQSGGDGFLSQSSGSLGGSQYASGYASTGRSDRESEGQSDNEDEQMPF